MWGFCFALFFFLGGGVVLWLCVWFWLEFLFCVFCVCVFICLLGFEFLLGLFVCFSWCVFFWQQFEKGYFVWVTILKLLVTFSYVFVCNLYEVLSVQLTSPSIDLRGLFQPKWFYHSLTLFLSSRFLVLGAFSYMRKWIGRLTSPTEIYPLLYLTYRFVTYEEPALLLYKMDYLFASLALSLFRVNHSGPGLSSITWGQHTLYDDFFLAVTN